MDLNELVTRAHATAVEKGWWEKPRDLDGLLMLVVSEASEALEEWRNGHDVNEEYFPGAGMHGPVANSRAEALVWAGSYGWKPEGIPSELADIVIRVADMCGYYGIDLAEAIETKMAYNAGRSYRHGGKRS